MCNSTSSALYQHHSKKKMVSNRKSYCCYLELFYYIHRHGKFFVLLLFQLFSIYTEEINAMQSDLECRHRNSYTGEFGWNNNDVIHHHRTWNVIWILKQIWMFVYLFLEKKEINMMESMVMVSLKMSEIRDIKENHKQFSIKEHEFYMINFLYIF